MVSAVALARTTTIMPLVTRRALPETAEAVRGKQAVRANIHNGFLPLRRNRTLRQRHGKKLIGTKRGVVADASRFGFARVRGWRRRQTSSLPLMPWFKSRIGTKKPERRRTVKRGDSYSLPDGLDSHEPIASVSAGMKVAVIDQHFHSETQGAVSTEQRMLNVGGVLALPHPDALFEQRVGKREPPHRNCAF